MRLSARLATLALIAALSGCAHDDSVPDGQPSPPCSFTSANDGVQSYAILCHDPVANRVKVKHVLIGWRELDPGGHPQDPRAQARTHAEAQALALDVLHRLQTGAAIEPLMAQYSEDPGSAQSGLAYDASPDAALVSPFKSLSLRLQVHEAGIVESPFGLHVIQRME